MTIQPITYDTRYAAQLIKSFNNLHRGEKMQSMLDDLFSWGESFAQTLFEFKEDDCLSTLYKPVHSLAPKDSFKTLYQAVNKSDLVTVKHILDTYANQVNEYQEVIELFDYQYAETLSLN